jgi:TMEM175 potassium channel family protein
MGTATVSQSQRMDRLVFFSDAVFAIVITLLVLPLTAEIEIPEVAQDLHHEVTQQWPKVISFAVSFLVIGQFWIAHHNMFGLLRRFDHGLLWLNLISLMTVSFMPFPTAVLGARLEETDNFPVVFYAASLAVSSIALTVTWLYAVRRHLTDPALESTELRQFTARALVTSAIFLLSIGAAFLGLLVAALFWLVLLPAGRILVPAVTRRLSAVGHSAVASTPRSETPDAP